MKNQKGPACLQVGETLIEAILALTIVIVIVTAVVIAVITALSGSSSNKNESAALGFAQEGIDVLRDVKSSDFAGFSATYSTAGYYCFGQNNIPDSNTANCPDTSSNIGTGDFVRKVYVNLAGNLPDGTPKCGSGAYAASIVSWSDGKCKTSANCHQVEIDSCFYNLNALTAP